MAIFGPRAVPGRAGRGEAATDPSRGPPLECSPSSGGPGPARPACSASRCSPPTRGGCASACPSTPPCPQTAAPARQRRRRIGFRAGHRRADGAAAAGHRRRGRTGRLLSPPRPGRRPGSRGSPAADPAALPDEVVSGALVDQERRCGAAAGGSRRRPPGPDRDPRPRPPVGRPARAPATGWAGRRRFGFAGDTAAAASELVAATERGPAPDRPVLLLVNLLLLMLFLRAVVAPLLLLGCSMRSPSPRHWVASPWCSRTGSATTGSPSTCRSRPRPAPVPRLRLQHLRRRPRLDPARHTTMARPSPSGRRRPPARSPLLGITLAASFGMLALVPPRQFRELAFVMGLGVLIDALVVRGVMVPGPARPPGKFSAWPRKLGGADADAPPPNAPTVHGLSPTVRSWTLR